MYEHPSSFRTRIRVTFFGYVALSIITACIVAVRHDTISGGVYTLAAATPIAIVMLVHWWPVTLRVVVTDEYVEGTSFFGRRTRIALTGDLLVQRFAARTIDGTTTWLRLRDDSGRSVMVSGEMRAFDDFWRDVTREAGRLVAGSPGLLDRITRGSLVDEGDGRDSPRDS